MTQRSIDHAFHRNCVIHLMAFGQLRTSWSSLKERYRLTMLDTPSALASSSDSAQELPALIFLGPPGTYSHQAAFDAFGDSVRYVAKQTIAGKSVFFLSLRPVIYWILQTSSSRYRPSCPLVSYPKKIAPMGQ